MLHDIVFIVTWCAMLVNDGSCQGFEHGSVFSANRAQLRETTLYRCLSSVSVVKSSAGRKGSSDRTARLRSSALAFYHFSQKSLTSP